MQKKNKLIILTLFMFILLPAASGITLEEQIFYDSIKEISDIENKSDYAEEKLIAMDNTNPEDIKDFCNDKIETISTEVDMLDDLKTQLSDDDYMEYVDIQINRLYYENKSYNAILEYADTYEQYLNGQINTSSAYSLLEDKASDVYYYSQKSDDYKYDAESFLNGYTYMKVKFNNLKIDNDFIYSSQYTEDISESLF